MITRFEAATEISSSSADNKVEEEVSVLGVATASIHRQVAQIQTYIELRAWLYMHILIYIYM